MADGTKKTTATKPRTTTKKPKAATEKLDTTTSEKPKTTPKKTTPKKTDDSVKTTKARKPKTTAKEVKTEEKTIDLTAQEVKTVKTEPKPRSTKKPKTTPKARVKQESELTTLEVLEAKVDGEPILEKQPLGKAFYLIFSLVFYAIAFFYIYTVVYNSNDILQSAIFAFAALFVAFVLMLFNIHKMVFYFFVLPFKRLVKQARLETHKEIIFSVGKNKVQTTFNKYRSLFTLILYGLLAGFIIYASVIGSIEQGDTVVQMIYSALITVIVFVVVINSWQFLFNIIPSILDKSIDAKNGYVLSMSAAVIVIYLIFLFFGINYMSEIMIFVLIIGFIALLGVNLNMIVGEINIFQNLRGKQNKAVTRVVFVIFFGFHIYVIIYASVVAYSIYNWETDAFNFSEVHYEFTVDDELYANSVLIDQVYDSSGNVVAFLYDSNGNQIDKGIDQEGMILSQVYFQDGSQALDFYDNLGGNLFNVVDRNGNTVNNYFFYEGRLAKIDTRIEKLHTYGDFLYWTVVTVSTIGYGDIYPSTEYPVAQAWGGFLGMYGLTFFALSISFVSNIAMEGVNIVRQENNKDD